MPPFPPSRPTHLLALCMTLVTLTIPAVATADGSGGEPSPLVVPSRPLLSVGDADSTAPAVALQPARQTNRAGNIWPSAGWGSSPEPRAVPGGDSRRRWQTTLTRARLPGTRLSAPWPASALAR